MHTDMLWQGVLLALLLLGSQGICCGSTGSACLAGLGLEAVAVQHLLGSTRAIGCTSPGLAQSSTFEQTQQRPIPARMGLPAQAPPGVHRSLC